MSEQRKVIFVCNMCGLKTDDEYEIKNSFEIMLPGLNLSSVDVCGNCSRKIQQWIESYFKEQLHEYIRDVWSSD